jgi:hypothetical protein
MRISTGHKTVLAKVAVQCSVFAQSRWLIKVGFSASIPIVIGMVKIATFAKPETVNNLTLALN